MCVWWQEAGRAEADFGRHDVRRVVRTIYILFSGADIPVAKEGQEIMDLADASTPLPPWLTEADLDVYASLYENSGFRFPLQMPYRYASRRRRRRGGAATVSTIVSDEPRKKLPAPIDSNYLIIDLYITPFVSKYLTPLTF
jgi:hypothetical protein